MKLTIKLNLDVLVNTALSGTFYLEFTNITDIQNWHEEENVTSLEFFNSSTYKQMYVFLDDASTPSYDEIDDNIVTLSENDDYIIFTCEIANSSYNKVMEFIQKGIIEFVQNGFTTIFVYKQNSKNIVIDKTLTFVDAINGKFNHSIAIKNINIDVTGYSITNGYNYAFIPSLNRYYYVDSVEIISNDYIRLHLREDVLMSWQDLIKSQMAFITRSADQNTSIVDERLPLESLKTIEYITPTPTGSGSQVNIQLSANFSSEYNIMITTYNDVYYTKQSVPSPDTNLPTLSPNQSNTQTSYFVTLSLYDSFTKALMDEDTMMSSLGSILFLPFNPTTPFNTGTSAQTLMIGLPDSKALCSDDKFHYLYDIPSGVTTRQVRRTPYGTSPYLVLADFTFPDTNDDWYNCEPYTFYEIYIAFVGWVKVDAQQLSNKRVLIYYTLDLQTGNGTAFIYNKTDGKVIYSCGCQLGVKLDVISSNYLELSREKQANQLNTLIGLLASAVSIGAGVVTENPVAIAGGVLSAGKTIASAVNKERMMFERAQVTFGSGDAGLHSTLGTMIRKTYNKQILSGYGLSYYYDMQGYPCNTYDSLGELTGYVEIGEIHFNPMNETIYQDETQEIVSLLKDGVIF